MPMPKALMQCTCCVLSLVLEYLPQFYRNCIAIFSGIWGPHPPPPPPPSLLVSLPGGGGGHGTPAPFTFLVHAVICGTAFLPSLALGWHPPRVFYPGVFRVKVGNFWTWPYTKHLDSRYFSDFVCKSPCGKDCRLNSDWPDAGDTFTIIQTGEWTLEVTRSDAESGWGLDLILPCWVPGVCRKEWKEHRGSGTGCVFCMVFFHNWAGPGIVTSNGIRRGRKHSDWGAKSGNARFGVATLSSGPWARQTLSDTTPHLSAPGQYSGAWHRTAGSIVPPKLITSGRCREALPATQAIQGVGKVGGRWVGRGGRVCVTPLATALACGTPVAYTRDHRRYEVHRVEGLHVSNGGGPAVEWRIEHAQGGLQ